MKQSIEVIKEKKFAALLLLSLLALFFFFASLSFMLAVTGAAILYVLLKPLYIRLNAKIGHANIAVALVLLLSLLVIVFPIAVITYYAAIDISQLLSDPANVDSIISIVTLGQDDTNFEDMLRKNALVISTAATQITLLAFNLLADVAVNLCIMYISLFFLLKEHKRVNKTMKMLLPFNDKNSETLMSRFHHVINATFAGNIIVSIIIGFLFAAVMFFFGQGQFFFWAVISTLASIIPIVGLIIIWLPVGLYYLFQGEYTIGIILLAWGAFLSFAFDGYARQAVQDRIADVHPFISLIGLLVGITFFGITGLIIGPVLIALFFLTAQMFKQEYLPNWK